MAAMCEQPDGQAPSFDLIDDFIGTG